MAYALVIFDMDGTLVDSETVAERVLTEVTQQLSKPMSADEVSETFRGRTIEYTLDVLAEREGAPLPESFLQNLNTRYIEVLGTELRATEGACETIEAVKKEASICVASNSNHDGIGFCLDSAGLLELFDANHLFAATDVKHPKPAPDLFLHAAAAFSVDPEQCLVIEDSELGLQAARAAGMDAIGFCGNDLSKRGDLAALGFPVIDTFSNLLPYLQR